MKCKRTIILLGFVFYLCAVSGCSRSLKTVSESDEVKKLYMSGVGKLEKNDQEGAESDFLKSVRLDDKSPMGYTGMALVELSRSEYGKAMRLVRKALKYDPDFVDAYITRGRILKALTKGEWLRDALASFEHALEIAPDNEKALYYCAGCYLSRYDFVKAEEYFDSTVRKQGSFKDRAAAKHRLVTRIIDAAPVSEAAKRNALADTINRSDLCSLIVKELKIKKLLKLNRKRLFENIYRYDYTLKKEKAAAVYDVSYRSMPWILDVIPLSIPELSTLPDGNFYPDRTITRAQMARIIHGLTNILSDNQALTGYTAANEFKFIDVHPEYYAYNAIMFCTGENIIKTDSSLFFRPEDKISGIDAVSAICNLRRALKNIL